MGINTDVSGFKYILVFLRHRDPPQGLRLCHLKVMAPCKGVEPPGNLLIILTYRHR